MLPTKQCDVVKSHHILPFWSDQITFTLTKSAILQFGRNRRILGEKLGQRAKVGFQNRSIYPE